MTLESPSMSQKIEPAVGLRLSVDPVLFTLFADRLQVLLRRRTRPPFAGMWSLPGAINPADEQLEETMTRDLDRLGFGEIWVEQLATFDRPPEYVDGELAREGRDPRGRVVSVAYIGLVPPDRGQIPTGQDELAWMPVDELPRLAFDHIEIVSVALRRLRDTILHSPAAVLLLPGRFTLTHLQRAYETVLGRQLDKRNFRRKVLDAGLVSDTGEVTQQGTRRPARLYRFAHDAYTF